MKSNTNTTWIIITVGVVIFLLMVSALYLFVTNPGGAMESRESVPRTTTSTDGIRNVTTASTSIEEDAVGGFVLSSAQVEALISLGIDPAAVPSSVSAVQEVCFVEALGEARVAEIKTGAVPSPLEFLRAKSCI